MIPAFVFALSLMTNCETTFDLVTRSDFHGKCPICVCEEQRSEVYPGCSSLPGTAICDDNIVYTVYHERVPLEPEHYDADGNYHPAVWPPPPPTYRTYHCSLGHQFRVETPPQMAIDPGIVPPVEGLR